MRDGDTNLLVLTLYIIGITYTFNQMVESIDDQVKIEFNKAAVDQQLKEQDLQGKIGISFSLVTKYKIDEPKELSISIENKSQEIVLYVDWDNCSFVEFDGVSRRVIRLSPDMTRDLGVPQVPSIVVPEKTLKEKISSEGVFSFGAKSDKEIGVLVYKPGLSVANVLKWEKSPVKAQRKQFREFMDRKRNFEFSLELVLRLASKYAGLAPGHDIPTICVIKCPFTIRKLPWTYALPWNKKR